MADVSESLANTLLETVWSYLLDLGSGSEKSILLRRASSTTAASSGAGRGPAWIITRAGTRDTQLTAARLHNGRLNREPLWIGTR